MTPNHTPRTRALANPYARVTIRACVEHSVHLHIQSCTKSSNGDVRSDAPHAQFLRLMRTEANNALRMRVEILRLGGELPIRTGEEEIVTDELVENGNVIAELRRSECRLECNKLGINEPDRDA